MKTFFIILFCIGHLCSFGQGIKFFSGDYNAAVEQAQKEGKVLFVDFYANWCGPCRWMEKETFSLDAIGKYFNEKFISLKINTEELDNSNFVKQNKIESLPTLIFFDVNGKVLSRTEGAVDAEALMKIAKVVCGEEMSFEELFAKFKSSKNDLKLTQQLLKEAPTYVGTLDGIEKEKWVSRIERIFKDYVNKKMGEELINADDYRIITTFHSADKPGDKLMEFINKNMKEYLKLGKGPAYFVVEYNNKIIENFARAGNDEYKKYLERIDGDMKLAYSVLPQNKTSVRQRLTLLYDAEYLLFYKKNSEEYMKAMESYFNDLGEGINADDYGMAAQNIFIAINGEVPDVVIEKTKEWMLKALQFKNIPLVDKVNYLVMLGDSNKLLQNYSEAKKCYNQAFMESFQLGEEMTQMMVQLKIKEKLGLLDLLE